MKTFILLICITGFIGLAWNSKDYKPTYGKQATRTEAKASRVKPVILPGTYRPKNEKDRARKIAEIWHIKGELHETRIFEARK